MNYKTKTTKLFTKIFAVMFASVMLLTGTVTAHADEIKNETENNETEKVHLMGDVNNDDDVNVDDSLLVLRYSIGFKNIEDDFVKYGDFDGDGSLTSVDALFILRSCVDIEFIKLNIIDVSYCQGVIDWDVTKDYIDGAIIRCGYGSDYTSQDDTQFQRNISECERLGIPIGIYLYSHASTETQAYSELNHILRLIKGHSFDLPIFLDCEQSGTEAFAARACEIICEGLKEAGFKPGVYANTYWWNTFLTSVTKYTRWVAQYNVRCTYEGDYAIWQYSCTGRVPGISCNVDMNYCYIDVSEFKNYKY